MSKKCADTHTQDDYCNPLPTLGLIIHVHVLNERDKNSECPITTS